MDGARLSRFPHLSWLRFGVDGLDAPQPTVRHLIARCHALCLEVTAPQAHDVGWITRGHEKHWVSNVGTMHFVPADDEQHTYVTRRAAFTSTVLLLPRGHLQHYLISEHFHPGFDHRRLLLHRDAGLEACMRRVCHALGQEDAGLDVRADEAARGLILRLAELSGAGKPDWHDDAGVFDRRTLARLLEHVDACLHIPPSLEDMSLQTGLSPSHFARKFRLSTGLSLHRFVNRRRIVRALGVLKDRSPPLAAVAIELGFSSQSHFTRLFSMLTGMTPAKYRTQCERTVG